MLFRARNFLTTMLGTNVRLNSKISAIGHTVLMRRNNLNPAVSRSSVYPMYFIMTILGTISRLSSKMSAMGQIVLMHRNIMYSAALIASLL